MLIAMLSLGHAAPPFTIEAPVNDPAGVISAADEARLGARLTSHYEQTGVQLAVLVVDSTLPQPIDDFSMAVAEAWAGGQAGEDRGLLLTLAVTDRRSRLEVGYGLEPIITDADAGRLLDAMKPALREQRYAAAVESVIEGVEVRTGNLARGEALLSRAQARRMSRAERVRVWLPGEDIDAPFGANRALWVALTLGLGTMLFAPILMLRQRAQGHTRTAVGMLALAGLVVLSVLAVQRFEEADALYIFALATTWALPRVGISREVTLPSAHMTLWPLAIAAMLLSAAILDAQGLPLFRGILFVFLLLPFGHVAVRVPIQAAARIDIVAMSKRAPSTQAALQQHTERVQAAHMRQLALLFGTLLIALSSLVLLNFSVSGMDQPHNYSLISGGLMTFCLWMSWGWLALFLPMFGLITAAFAYVFYGLGYQSDVGLVILSLSGVAGCIAGIAGIMHGGGGGGGGGGHASGHAASSPSSSSYSSYSSSSSSSDDSGDSGGYDGGGGGFGGGGASSGW